jgi:hypothetical protein
MLNSPTYVRRYAVTIQLLRSKLERSFAMVTSEVLTMVISIVTRKRARQILICRQWGRVSVQDQSYTDALMTNLSRAPASLQIVSVLAPWEGRLCASFFSDMVSKEKKVMGTWNQLWYNHVLQAFVTFLSRYYPPRWSR